MNWRWLPLPPMGSDLAAPDTSNPSLTSASLPTVDVTGGGETVTFSAGAFDTGSGVDKVIFYFDKSWQGPSGSGSVVTLSDATDSFADGNSALPVYFDPATPAGTYAITSVIVYDKAGNWTDSEGATAPSRGTHSTSVPISGRPGTSRTRSCT
ncbi:MAG TPA: hypothetical protein VLJ39_13045, partial [Tepidisphaeraceae bacterium]|nr:hypothetical protein [Tepidisphaeraceae bacterium]